MYANKISEVQCIAQSSIAGIASDLIKEQHKHQGFVFIK